MMKLEKEQRTQFIVLCSLLVVVLGFGIFRMMGSGTSANSATATTASTTQSAAPANAQPTTEQPTPGGTPDVAAYVQPVKDPFEPQVLPGDMEQVAAVTPSPKLPAIERETRIPLPVMPSLQSDSVSVAPLPIEPPVDPTKDMKLTGVIEGEFCVAIIRAGDTRHIVREGQSIDGKLIVRSISRAGVRLSHNGRSYFLPLSAGKST